MRHNSEATAVHKLLAAAANADDDTPVHQMILDKQHVGHAAEVCSADYYKFVVCGQCTRLRKRHTSQAKQRPSLGVSTTYTLNNCPAGCCSQQTTIQTIITHTPN